MPVIGIDEVGRGAWAGPMLVVAAMQYNQLPSGLTDSKLLSRVKRDSLYKQLILSCSFGEGWVNPEEIDNLGLTDAMRLGVKRALKNIGAINTDTLIIDGKINYCPSSYKKVFAQVKADVNEPIVSAASVYAKVSRDNAMKKLAGKYAQYQFERHVGYGTQAHIKAIKLYGACKIHRLSYKPLRSYL